MGTTTRNPIAIFLVPFTLLWGGGSLGGIYGSQLAEGRFDPARSLAGLPFLLGTIVLVAVVSMFIWGRVEVEVKQGRGAVFTGVGRLGWRRAFDWSAVTAVRSERVPGSRGVYSNRIALDPVLKLGSGLPEARRTFIVEVLESMLAERRAGDRFRPHTGHFGG